MTVDNLIPDFGKRMIAEKTVDGQKVPVYGIIAIAQDQKGQVLMQGFMTEETYQETLETKTMVYYSTSRNKRWEKGATSGDYQKVIEAYLDCDLDAALFIVEQQGDGACHTKAYSCFYTRVL